MDIPKDCIHNLTFDLKECLEAATKHPNGHDKASLAEAADIIRILEYIDRPTIVAGVQEKALYHQTIFNITEMAVNEMTGAELYWKQYEHSSDDRFRRIAIQKLAHSAALTQYMESHGAAGDAAAINARRMQLERIIK